VEENCIMLITTANPTTDGLEKTYLADPISAGATTLAVINNNTFAADDRIMVGEMGNEKTEIVTVSSVSGGTAILSGATVFSHEVDTPVYRLRFDQIKIYRSTTGSDGVYSLLATLDVDVDNQDLNTYYDDTSGTSSYYYKTTAYHSVSTLESAFSDPIAGSGWRRNQVGSVIDEILDEVGDPQEQHVTRKEVLGYFNDVNDDLTTHAPKPYDFLRTRTTLTRTANAITVDFPTDSNGDPTMWKFDRMDYNFSDTATDPDTDAMDTITKYDEVEFRNLYSNLEVTASNVSDAKPVAMALDTAVDKFRYWPASENTITNAFYLYYWKYFTRIDSEGDVVETPTARIYKLYAKTMYYRKRATLAPDYSRTAQEFYADYLAERSKYKGVNRMDKGTPRGFKPASKTFKGYRR
jgi:hypothetical protein